MAVADVFTAIAEDRPYRKGMSKSSIVKILSEMSSNKFLEPKIITLLIDNYTDINDYVKIIQESAQEFYDARLKII